MRYIYHLTHKNNFESLLKHNILSKNLIIKKEIEYEDISMKSAQNFRKKKMILCSQGNFSLHNYVPFFFKTTTPMLKYLKYNYSDYENLFFCKASTTSVFKNEKSYFAFSNGNLASPKSLSYYSWKMNKNKIDWDCMNMRGYPNDDPELKRKLSSEFLVLDMFDITLLDNIIIQSDDKYYRSMMQKYKIDISIQVNRNYFF